MEHRQIGSEFSRLARIRLTVLDKRPSEITPGLTVVEQLTPDEDLLATFPRSLPGTIYHFFVTDNTGVGELVFFHPNPNPNLSRIYDEAALGMMDNQAYR